MRRFWRSNVVEILRTRLGPREADRLMSDAAMPGHPQRAALSRRIGGMVDVEELPCGVVLSIITSDGPPSWNVDVLHTGKTLPETVLVHLPGRPMHEVVQGSSADMHVIREAWNGADGLTSIRVEAALVPASSIRLGFMARITQPLRWLWNVQAEIVEIHRSSTVSGIVRNLAPSTIVALSCLVIVSTTGLYTQGGLAEQAMWWGCSVTLACITATTMQVIAAGTRPSRR